MLSIQESLPYVQIILAIILSALILLQRSGTTLSGAFGGGDNFSSMFHTRRGAEKYLFRMTIVVGIMFTIASLATII